ncbi:dopamine N-acetyltransferase-like [Ceratina calcarata]|uniref:Dopamine N-acetyltransferase-like n=1 Tax=Ceratina calcarata TaxID=156304 RepID=A0AAJ7IQY8_9HYME|nr:dopamine N-acetyltransferase-like [Ceratina calcarata]
MAALLLKSYGRFVLNCLKRVSNSSRFAIAADFHFTAINLAKCVNKPAYQTRLALPLDYDTVVDFMCEEYYKMEPTIVNIGLGNTEAPPVMRALLYEQVKAGLSIIAEDRENCIIGAALNYVTGMNEGKRLYEIAKCCECGPMRDVVEFWAFIADAPRIWERYCIARIFEQATLCVSKDYQQLGIATRLVQESWVLARDCGYRLFRIDCMSSYTANIARGFGWPMLFDIPFSQYVKNGEVLFKCVKEPHTVCRVFVDHLQYCKTYCPPYKKCTTVTAPPTDVKPKKDIK